MKGTERYRIVPTGQYGRLCVVNSSHARGRTLRVYLMPKDTDAEWNGPGNAPLNYEVELFGIVSGQPGWTEVYDWIHKGPWVDDFESLVRSLELKKEAELKAAEAYTTDGLKKEQERVAKALAEYDWNFVCS